MISAIAKLRLLAKVHILDMQQPIINKAARTLLYRSGDPSTTVMTTNDDVLDLKHVNRILNHGKAVEIRVDHKVGHIAMNKKLARQQPYDFVGRHAAVGTANPEILRTLLRCEFFKKGGVDFFDPCRPLPVVGK